MADPNVPKNIAFNALRAQSERIQTTSPIRDNRQATRDSLLLAILSTLVDGNITNAEFIFSDVDPELVVDDIGMFLFLQDAPITSIFNEVVNPGWVQAIDAAAAPVAGVFSYTGPFNTWDPVAATNASLGLVTVATSAEPAELNEAVEGDTVTNGVHVVGYPVRAEWIDPQLSTLASGDRSPRLEDPSTAIEVVSGGANLYVHCRSISDYGQGGYVLLTETQQLNQVVPVILEETLYTQEIFDNDNMFVDAAGNTVVVVGIFNRNPDVSIPGGGVKDGGVKR